MTLLLEWRETLEAWRNEPSRHCYEPLGAVALSGFVTKEQLRVEEALTRQFAPMAPGTAWGTKWEYAWNGPWLTSPVVREGYGLNCPVTVCEGAAGEQSLLSVNAESIVIETVKPAEDRSDGVIVRLYEAKGTSTRCALSISLAVNSARQTDMLEQAVADGDVDGNRIDRVQSL